jgi:hypothetical protein
MRARKMKAGKLTCDVCGKPHATLGSYGDRDSESQMWWMCLKCFGKADDLAAKQDRWPDARDFKAVKEAMR